MNNDIQTLITDFHKLLYKDENHRYKSWEHCYSFFKSDVVDDDIDKACLHLAFYLASWGMYRGSSFLLWKDYKIHMKVVERILQNKELQYLDFTSANEEELKKIIELSNWIKNWYKENIDEVRKMIFNNSNIDYPAMKLIDMYFWEIGFRNDN